MTTTRKITFDEGESESRRHNWHLDADGVEVAKGQGEGVPEQQETAAEHSPLPWKVTEGNMGPKGDATIDIYSGERFICGIEGHSREEMQRRGYFSIEQMEANAAYIVKACNEYENVVAQRNELLTACKRLAAWVGKGIADNTYRECVLPYAANVDLKMAEAAIANASKPADPFTDEKLHEMGCSYDREQIDGGE